MGKVIRRNVSPDVMDRNKWFSRCHAKPFRKIHPDQQSTDQTGGIGHRNRVNLFKRELCLLQRLAYHAYNVLTMAAGGNFRNNSSVFFMFFHLGGDD